MWGFVSFGEFNGTFNSTADGEGSLSVQDNWCRSIEIVPLTSSLESDIMKKSNQR